MKASDLGSYAFLALSWGLSFLVMVEVVDAFGWVGAVSFRCFVAAGALSAGAIAARRRLDFACGWPALMIVGATTVAGQLLGLAYGMPKIGTSMSAIIVATIPLFSMIIGRALGLERLSRRTTLGLALGLAGIVLLVGFPSAPVTGDFVLGTLATVAAAICAAVGSLYAAYRIRATGPAEVTIGSFLAGGLLTLPFLALVPVPRAPLPVDFAYLLVAGAVMSGINYLVYFRLVGRVGATRAISVEFLVTVVAVAIGTLWLGERLTAMQIAGASVILTGCALVLGLVGGGDTKKAPETGA